MIARASAILEALKGSGVRPAVAERVIAAFLPEDIDPDTLTNEQKAAHFVREMRRLTIQRVLQVEEEEASEVARLAVRADVLANVDLGND